MNKALAGVLAVALAGFLAGSARAQVPNVQVYFDPAFTQTQTECGTGEADLYVVLNNFNMEVTAADFEIAYPPQLTWLSDALVDVFIQSSIGTSPLGVVVAWANCCAPDGFLPVLALIPHVEWGPCDCQGGPYAIVVGGYSPLGKPNPTAVRKSDFEEISGIGMTSLICPHGIPVESSTWGGVKALYR